MTTETKNSTLAPGEHEFTVPSGKLIRSRKGIGRDMINAMRKTKDHREVMFALAAELITVDGAPIIYEDLLEMDLADVMTIQQEMGEVFMPSQTPKE
jgi:DNA-binding transcriptional regulator YbjK